METATRPAEVELRADLTVGDGVQEMLAGALGALQRRASAARTPGAETVHRFRVGLRRLRSVLSAFGGAFPERERRALGERLSVVAGRFGRVREWDVFLAGVAAPLHAAMPAEVEALAVLERLARKARRAAIPPGDTLTSNLATVEDAITEASWLRRPTPEKAKIWQTPLRDYAEELLGKRHRKLRRELKQADPGEQAALHVLRIQVKKLRYSSELLKSLFNEDRAKAYLDRLVALQDVMGRLNDARIDEELRRELALPEATQYLLTGWLARELAASRERFPRCARALRRADPFWEN
jgi:CHAD domain-containing protein